LVGDIVVSDTERVFLKKSEPNRSTVFLISVNAPNSRLFSREVSGVTLETEEVATKHVTVKTIERTE
jgi:hypothetical protein